MSDIRLLRLMDRTAVRYLSVIFRVRLHREEICSVGCSAARTLDRFLLGLDFKLRLYAVDCLLTKGRGPLSFFLIFHLLPPFLFLDKFPTFLPSCLSYSFPSLLTQNNEKDYPVLFQHFHDSY